MEIYKKNKKAFNALAGLLVLGALVWGVKAVRGRDHSDDVLIEAEAGESVLTGTFTCLTLKNGEPVTDANCVMGLLSDDKKIYALNSTKVDIISKTIGVKDRVRIVGKLSSPNLKVDEGNAFKIDGVMDVRAIQRARELETE